MFKKIVCSIAVIALIVINLRIPTSRAQDVEELYDQGCLSVDGTFSMMGLPLSQYYAKQIFFPSHSMLDGVYLSVYSAENVPRAKARVDIVDVSRPNATLLVRKFFSAVNTDNVVYVDFDDIAIPAGTYAVIVRAVEDKEVYWDTVDTLSDCYPNGYAILENQTFPTMDMMFAIDTYDPGTNTSNPSSTTDPVDQSTTPNSPSNPTSSTSTPATSNISNQQTTTSSKTLSSLSGTVESKTAETNAKVENTVTAESKAFMSDKEKQELIAWILADYEENHPSGAFGLSGIAGRILTWPVFYGICGILFLIIIILTWRSAKNRKNNLAPKIKEDIKE